MPDTSTADQHRRDWIAAQIAKAPVLSPSRRRRIVALLNPPPAVATLLNGRPSMVLTPTANGPGG